MDRPVTSATPSYFSTAAYTPINNQRQEEPLQAGVNKSAPLEKMDRQIKRLAEGWLKLLLAPLEKQVVFGDPPPYVTTGKTMMTYLIEHDSGVTAAIRRKELTLAKLTASQLGTLDPITWRRSSSWHGK